MIAFNWNVLEWPGMNTAFLVFSSPNVLTRSHTAWSPLSWHTDLMGEAMVGSVYAFGVMFLAFGIVPHQWIDHADKDLAGTAANHFGPGGISSLRRMVPIHPAIRSTSRHHRRRVARRLTGVDLHVDLAAKRGEFVAYETPNKFVWSSSGEGVR